jgi:SET domain-containing protein
MTDKDKLIKHLENDIYCRLAPSSISGIGVIAIKTIPINTDPFKTLSSHKDKVVQLLENDISHLDKNVHKILADFFGNNDRSTGKKRVIYDVLSSGPNNINISFYLNHSDEPNISIIDTNNIYLSFISNREIKVGEELTIDYNQYEY